MIIKGDKIKQIKAICGFNQIGEVFDVVDVLANGTIAFQCDFGVGVMSYDEFNEHFEKVFEKEKITQWTDWACHEDECGDEYLYRTDGKTIEMKTCYGLMVTSKCNDDDVFDLYKGLDLCVAKMQVEIAYRALKDAQEDLEDILAEM